MAARGAHPMCSQDDPAKQPETWDHTSVGLAWQPQHPWPAVPTPLTLPCAAPLALMQEL